MRAGGQCLSTWEAQFSDDRAFHSIHKRQIFADGLQIYTHSRTTNVNTAVEGVNSDISKIVERTEKHGLKLKPKSPPNCYLLYF